jgi:DNA-binding XRE family transcriptional regulator
MDTQMQISGDLVRTLREEKSWSQEHLASASGLSVRTVQRVESEGVGSAETRLALAGALGVPVATLVSAASLAAADATYRRHSPIGGWLGWGVGGASAVGAVAYNYYAGHIGAGEAGTALGIICAFLGTTAGAMGALAQRIKARGPAA